MRARCKQQVGDGSLLYGYKQQVVGEGREGGVDEGLLLYQIQVTGSGRRKRWRHKQQLEDGLLLYQYKQQVVGEGQANSGCSWISA